MYRKLPLLLVFALLVNLIMGLTTPHASAITNSSLQNIKLSSGSLNTPFSSTISAYTATVANNVDSITVTPTTGKASSIFGYAVFVGGPSPSGLTISGNSNTIVGNVHVNGDLSLKGNSNAITQTAEVVGEVSNQKGNIGQIKPSTVMPMPQINVTEFKKSASKIYSSTYNTTDVALDGNVFVDGDINISGSKIQGQGIIVASGSIHISGSNLKYSGPNDRVVFYSMNGDIHIAGSGGEIDGGLFAPNGQLKLTGHDNKIYGSVVVNDLDIAGSINQIVSDSKLGEALVRVNGKVVSSGSTSQSIPLKVGQNTISVQVTEFDGTLNSYTITVTRQSNDAFLTNLTLSSGGVAIPFYPPFAKNTTAYTANVANSVSTVVVQATVEDPTATVVYKLGNNTVDPKNVPLVVGSNLLSVIVTSQDGSKTIKYNINISRAPLSNSANLGSLTIDPGTLSPSFATGTYSFTGEIPKGTQSVLVSAAAADQTATVKINNAQPQVGKSSLTVQLYEGINNILVTVTSPDGLVSVPYTIVIVVKSSDADLSNLMVSSNGTNIPLSPDFEKSKLDYRASVGYEVTSVAVQASTNHPQAAVIYKMGGNVIDPNNVPLEVGPNFITVEVTAEDGTQRTYTITINRSPANTNATLSALSIDPGSLSPDYSPEEYHYVGVVGAGTRLITVSARAAEATASIQINGSQPQQGQASSPVVLSVGTNIIHVLVTAQDTAKTEDYTITIVIKSSDADLTNLIVSSGGNNIPITPAFDQDELSYSANVGSEVSTVSVQATTEDPNATITYFLDGQAITDPTAIPLHPGDNKITVVITAEDGSTQTYTVTIHRAASPNADLVNMILSQGTLSPAFDAATMGYTAEGLNGVDRLSVVPTVSDPSAKITVNGETVASGQSSSVVMLQPGTNKITVIVTSPDHSNQKTYEITIICPNFEVQPTGIYGDYLFFKVTPVAGTVDEKTNWHFKNDNSQEYEKDPNFTGTYTNGFNGAITLSRNKNESFIDDQTFSVIAQNSNGTTYEIGKIPIDLTKQYPNEQGQEKNTDFAIKVGSTGGAQNSSSIGNRAAKLSMSYYIKIPEGFEGVFEAPPTFIMKDREGEKGQVFLEGTLPEDGKGKFSTPVVKFVKSISGYTEKYILQVQIEHFYLKPIGDDMESHRLPLVLYSNKTDVVVESKENLQ